MTKALHRGHRARARLDVVEVNEFLGRHAGEQEASRGQVEMPMRSQRRRNLRALVAFLCACA
jgi:hypothetical protein